MGFVIQAHTSHNRYILRSERSEERFHDIFLVGGRGVDWVVSASLEDFDFEAAGESEGIDVGMFLVGGDDGVAETCCAVLGGDVADQAGPGGCHGG